MAWTSGTATNLDDLLSDLRTFLNGLPGWTEREWATFTQGGAVDYDEVTEQRYLVEGPGRTNGSPVFLAFETARNSSVDAHFILASACTGLSVGSAVDSQPGVGSTFGSAHRAISVSNSNMPYWFVANDLGVHIVVQVGALLFPCYFGQLQVFGSPTELPQIILNAGNYGRPDDNISLARFSNSLVNSYIQFEGGYGPDPNEPGVVRNPQAIRDEAGRWMFYTSSTRLSFNARIDIMACRDTGAHPDTRNQLTVNASDEAFLVQMQYYSISGVLGEVPGMYAVRKTGISALDTLDVAGRDFLVLTNRAEATPYSFFALELV